MKDYYVVAVLQRREDEKGISMITGNMFQLYCSMQWTVSHKDQPCCPVEQGLSEPESKLAGFSKITLPVKYHHL